MDEAVMSVQIRYPKFAVVGHPNKGKSSIVSSLAMDDSIAISDRPGTTTKNRNFPLKVDGEILYELFDTPGFQRARQVLAWLKKHDVSADKRHEVVQNFIHAHREDPKFNDEVQLLEPIMDGAGIIYVVDASKPYGKEYEAEMEILRWTGQPRMVLINHIEGEDYADDWKRGLGGYFQMIRTYDPMYTDPAQHLAVLESMAQLREEWTPQIKASMRLFERYRSQMVEQSAEVIAALLLRSLSHIEQLPLRGEKATEGERADIEEMYKEVLRHFEIQAQLQIEQIWNHLRLKKSAGTVTFEGIDLFSEESASVFGLTRKELMITAATTGAVTGAGIDLLFAGHTLFLGGAIGAVAGGVGAWFAFNELSEIKLLGQQIGKHYLETGPMKNRNFPYILLGRMLYYTVRIATLSHALRGEAEIQMDEGFKSRWLDESVRRKLEGFHKIFRLGRTLPEEKQKAYERLILEQLQKLLTRKV
jgi:GTPase Era involved in 16S rRNA processing